MTRVPRRAVSIITFIVKKHSLYRYRRTDYPPICNSRASTCLEMTKRVGAIHAETRRKNKILAPSPLPRSAWLQNAKDLGRFRRSLSSRRRRYSLPPALFAIIPVFVTRFMINSRAQCADRRGFASCTAATTFSRGNFRLQEVFFFFLFQERLGRGLRESENTSGSSCRILKLSPSLPPCPARARLLFPSKRTSPTVGERSENYVRVCYFAL